MKGDKQIVDYLNRALTYELTAVNQYYLHYKMQENWGFKKLAEHTRAESFEEMKHADRLADRILFLEGLPNFQDLKKVSVGENVAEQFRLDLALETQDRPLLQEALQFCRTKGDDVTKEIFQNLLEDTEEHIDWLETQLGLIEKVGLQNYLQSMM